MRKRFQISRLNKLIGREAASHEVAGSHAYGRVARDTPSVPRARPARPPRGKASGYRDSMVGSIAQYRDTTPIAPRRQEAVKDATKNGNVVGNRPSSGRSEAGTGSSATGNRRHSFVEPPKRNYNRFD